MSDIQFRSIHRKFTADEKRRFEEGKKWAGENMPAITAQALAKKAELEALQAAVPELVRAREARGMTVEQVAAGAGIDAAELTQLETLPYPPVTLDLLSRLADAIGVRLVIGVADEAA